MHRKICFLIFFISTFSFAQDIERVLINGKINVPEGDDPDGITIFNETTNRGTISNEAGEFNLSAKDGDRFVFSSLQFEQFSIFISSEIIKTKTLNVSVNIAINELPQVTVSPSNLTGSIRVDVNRIQVTPAQIPNMNVQMANRPNIATPESYPVRNQAQLSGQTYMVNGLNLKNIFKVITGTYGDKKNNYRAIPYRDLDDEIKKMYSNDFFKETLNLDSTQVNDFIFFAADNGLDGEMLSEENELNIIQFLTEQRTAYQQFLDAENEDLD